MMRPGKLDQRITFQAYTLSPDGAGGQTKTWANLTTTPTVWAHAKPVRGTESFSEDRTNATSTVMFTIRNRGDLTDAMRIVWGGVNYNIRDIRRAGSREMYLTIIAERGVST